MIDLRRIVTGVQLTRAELLESELGALRARTERRQKVAKAALKSRGIRPRIQIGSAYMTPATARNFAYVSIGGAR